MDANSYGSKASSIPNPKVNADTNIAPITNITQLPKEGIHLSRRVIAKYREQLKIPSSSKRKRFEEN